MQIITYDRKDIGIRIGKYEGFVESYEIDLIESQFGISRDSLSLGSRKIQTIPDLFDLRSIDMGRISGGHPPLHVLVLNSHSDSLFDTSTIKMNGFRGERVKRPDEDIDEDIGHYLVRNGIYNPCEQLDEQIVSARGLDWFIAAMKGERHYKLFKALEEAVVEEDIVLSCPDGYGRFQLLINSRIPTIYGDKKYVQMK